MTGSRLYKTGDLARYRFDGQIEFLRRIDQQLKYREIAEILQISIETVKSQLFQARERLRALLQGQ